MKEKWVVRFRPYRGGLSSSRILELVFDDESVLREWMRHRPSAHIVEVKREVEG